MEENKNPGSLSQRDYQKKYDKKTKTISIKYVLSDMDNYERLREYLKKTGQSANGFIKGLINDFFEQKYILNGKKIADFFKDYSVSEEMLDKLENIVGNDRFNIIMDYYRDCIETELEDAYLDEGCAFDEWIEQFLEDIECGDIDINVSEEDFFRIIDTSISDCMGSVFYN